MYVVGVSKKASNVSKRMHNKPKRHWTVYLYNESGNFFTKRIHWYQVPYYYFTKKRIVNVNCSACRINFRAIADKTCPQCFNTN